MAAATHNPAFAKKAGISQSVAEEFNSADEKRASGERSLAAHKRRRVAALSKMARRANRRRPMY